MVQRETETVIIKLISKVQGSEATGKPAPQDSSCFF